MMEEGIHLDKARVYRFKYEQRRSDSRKPFSVSTKLALHVVDQPVDKCWDDDAPYANVRASCSEDRKLSLRAAI